MNFSLPNKLPLTCIGLFLLNFILKLVFIASTDIGLDEPFTLFHSQNNIQGIIQLLKIDNNLPLHILIMHFWVKLFGTGIVSARFLSVLFSSFAAVAIFLTGKKHFSFQTGLIAALVFSASNTQMYYAHDARVYTLFMLLSILNLNLFLDLMNSKKVKYNPLILFTITNFFLCFSHLFGFAIIFSQVLICLLIPAHRKLFTKIAASFGILLLSYSWYIPIVLDHFKNTSKGNWIPFPLLTDLYTMIWRFSNVPVLAVTFITIIFYALILKWKTINTESENRFKIIVILFSIYYFGLFFISLKIPLFIDRYLLFTSTYFYLIVACSLLIIIKSANRNWALALIPVIIMFSTLDLKKGKATHTKAMVDFVRQELAHSANLIITPEWFDINFTYYYSDNWFKYTDHLHDTLKSHLIFPVNHIDNIPDIDITIPAILIDNNTQNDSIQLFLNSRYAVKEEKDFGGGLRVVLYNVK